MRSWSKSFTHRADERRRSKHPCGFVSQYMTDDGPIPLSEALARFGYAKVMGHQ